MQFSKERLKLIEALLEAAGWEKKGDEDALIFHTPKHYNLDYYQVGSYHIYDAIRFQTKIDQDIVGMKHETLS